MHCAVMTGSVAFSILPPATEPQIFIGSCSDFSSSPLMNGMTLSTISGQVSKVFPAPRDRLVRADRDPLRAELHERVDRRDVALERAVRLHRDEAALRAEPLALRLDDRGVLRVDLGDHHRHVGRAAVGRVVRDDRRLRLARSPPRASPSPPCSCRRRRRRSRPAPAIAFTSEAFCTTRPATAAGICDLSAQRPLTASAYFWPAELALAARSVTSNQGWFSSSGEEALTDHAGRAEDADLELLLGHLLPPAAGLRSTRKWPETVNTGGGPRREPRPAELPHPVGSRLLFHRSSPALRGEAGTGRRRRQ